MRNIKLIVAAVALLGLLSSCEKDFTVKTGNTPVEFLSSTMDVELNSVYNYIPIQMTDSSKVSSRAIVEFVGGTITMKEDGSTREVVNGTDVIFTSLDLYIGAYDPAIDTTSFPNNSIEFRLPNYLQYQSISPSRYSMEKLLRTEAMLSVMSRSVKPLLSSSRVPATPWPCTASLPQSCT